MHMQLFIVYRYNSLFECCLSWMNLFYFWFQVQQVQQNAVFHRPSATEKYKPPPPNGLSNKTHYLREEALYYLGLICLFIIAFFIS